MPETSYWISRYLDLEIRANPVTNRSEGHEMAGNGQPSLLI